MLLFVFVNNTVDLLLTPFVNIMFCIIGVGINVTLSIESFGVNSGTTQGNALQCSSTPLPSRFRILLGNLYVVGTCRLYDASLNQSFQGLVMLNGSGNIEIYKDANLDFFSVNATITLEQGICCSWLYNK